MMKICKGFISIVLCVVLTLGVVTMASGKEDAVPGKYYNLTDYVRLTGKKISKFNEAPQLSELVRQGKLPSVDQRIPKNPVVIKPWEELGQYGGTWRRVWFGLSDSAGPWKLAAETIVFWSSDGKIVPNIAERWQVSKDAKEYTFYLRKGIKWSDGQPFTADDIMFWYKDIILNKDLTPSPPWWFQSGGKAGEVIKIDDYTVKVRFSEPNGVFLLQAANVGEMYAPKHYLKQFHPNYVSLDQLNALAKKEGFDFWYQLFAQKNAWLQNPDRPTIYPWKVTVPGQVGTRMVMERNPYYWKIDTNGNQLPYIDKITHDLVENVEMVNLKAVSGEIDMQMRHMSLSNYTLLMENRQKGGYRVLLWTPGTGAEVLICLNQTVQDEVLKKLFRDKRFRFALSLAINREEINQLFFLGLGKPRQASLISSSPYYSKEWEEAYAEYNPKRANALLDELGLTNRDRDGFRLRPDGKTLSLTILASTTTQIGPLEAIKKYWEEIGVKTIINPVERSLLYTRVTGNQYEVTVWGMDRSYNPLIEPLYLVPFKLEIGIWYPLYVIWYDSGGKSGEQPPKDVARLRDLWERIKATPSDAVRARLLKEICRLHAENIWLIGTVGEVPTPVVVKNNFRNVPEKLVTDTTLLSPRNAYPEQFFIKTK